jgi:DNA-binding CsgD family transcriptional regulator
MQKALAVTTTQGAGVTKKSSSEGFLLLDSQMNPIFVNPAAAQILAYPQKLETQKKNLNAYLVGKIRSTVLSDQPPNGSPIVRRFQSGRRQYVSRVFRVDAAADSGPFFAVILERASTKSASLLQLSERFHLTTREQEVAQFLLQGLTSKEIGTRMQISPNTVKAFLRLIMVKMGVSTRSGVVGKALAPEL